jgi:hypothetical protein
MNTKPTTEDQAEAEQEFYERNAVVMDEEDAARQEFHRAALKRIDEFFLRGLRMLVIQKKIKRCLSFDCFIFAIGQGEMIGAQTAVEIARRYGVTKAAATECVDDFRQALKIEMMPGQRDSDGRKKMAQAKKDQLHK